MPSSRARARLSTLPRAWLVPGATFLTALAVLLAVHAADRPHYRLSHADAVRAALASPGVRKHLGRYGYSRAEVHPFDADSQRVSFFDGPRLTLDAAVDDAGQAAHLAPRYPGVPPSGARAAFAPLLWLALAAALVFAAAGARLRSLRTLDLAATLGLLVPVACYQDRLVAATVLTALPSLLYLLGRCAWVALRDPAPGASPPLYERLTAAWGPARRRRLLVGLAAAVGVAVALIAITSNGPSDVDLASMSGATLLLHGTLPYGHMPVDVVHGDTYPLLNYALHVPAALVLPVRDGFDDLTGGLVVAALAALAAAAGVAVAGARATRSRTAGLRLGLAWLAFPPVLIAASGGTNDLLLAACLAWWLAWAAWPGRATAALALAAWVKLLPILLVPVWLARLRGRELARGVAALAAVTVAALGLLVTLGGIGGVHAMAHALSFQFGRGSLYSAWAVLGVEAAQPVAQAALVALVAALALRARRDKALGRDPRRLAAAAGAVLLGLQVTANYWTYAYLPWAFACVAIALLTDAPARSTDPVTE